jgi:hypothetical protein
MDNALFFFISYCLPTNKRRINNATSSYSDRVVFVAAETRSACRASIMGCGRAGAGANYSDAIEVPVPSDDLWEIVADLESIPEILDMVTSFERISGGGSEPLAVGTRFRETRTHRGQDYTLYKTVTRLQATPTEEDGERSLSLGISIQNPNGKTNDVVNTSTLIVQPVDEATSRLILTVAITWGSFWDHVHHLFCGCFIRTMVMRGLTQEVEDYRNAAVERVAKRSSR